ncbi:unnamed protein product [Symbiodinium microadriaticum]|nr:unnamed protein product [Symbiodinium microadriaticum]
MDQLVAFEDGSIEILEFSWPPTSEDQPSATCVAYCIMRRPSGFLLCIPEGFLSPVELEAGQQASEEEGIGPSLAIRVPPVRLEETGEWVAVQEPLVPALVVDLAAQLTDQVAPADLSSPDLVPFVSGQVMVFPRASELLRRAKEWLGTSGVLPDDRAGYHTALSGQEQAAGPAAKERQARAKKPTVAQLASQQAKMMDLMASLVARLDAVAPAEATPQPPKAQPAVELPAQRAVLQQPVSSVLPPCQTVPKQLALSLGPPPPVRRQPPAAEEQPDKEELMQEALGVGELPGDMSSAVLAQSQALFALVSQMSSGAGDPLLDVPAGQSSSSVRGSVNRARLQEELATRGGTFATKVRANMARRMDPTGLLAEDQVSYMNEVPRTPWWVLFPPPPGLGCLAGCPVAGLVAHWICGRGPDSLSLLLVMLHQAALDKGNHTLGWLLTLQADPPASLFAPQVPLPGSSLQCFTPLADQRWITVGLAYIETIAGRISESPAKGGPGKPPPKPPALPPPAVETEEAQLGSPQSSTAAAKEVTSKPFCPSGPLSAAPGPEDAPAPPEVRGDSFPLSGQTASEVPPFDFAVAKGSLSRFLRPFPPCRLTMCLPVLGVAASTWLPVFLREALQPYRSIRAAEVVLHGRGAWPLEKHLSPDLYLPYVEPEVLRCRGPPAPSPVFSGEGRGELVRLCKVWDSSGLLGLTPGPLPSRLLARVFGAYKGPSQQRQIGDRRGINALECRLFGPSSFMPTGPLLCRVHVPPGCCLCGSVTDRRDFYTQAGVSLERSLTNACGPAVPLALLKDTSAAKALLDRGTHDVVDPGLYEGIVGFRRPPLLVNEKQLVHPTFKALFQGDAGGVEYATSAHEGLLQAWGCLLGPGRLEGRSRVSGEGPWQGLIIDDFFSLSVEGPDFQPGAPSLSSAQIDRAKEGYSAEGVLGSDNKEVRSQRLLCVAGAQLDSTEATVADGATLCGYPVQKRLALAAASVRAAQCPVLSEELASSLAGCWVSCLLYRRCFMSVLDGLFALGRTSSAQNAQGSDLRELSRRTAGELQVLAVVAPILTSNLSAAPDSKVYASDASNLKGAFCTSEIDPGTALELWLASDFKGESGKLAPTRAPASFDDGEAASEAEADEAPPASSKPFAYEFDFLEEQVTQRDNRAASTIFAVLMLAGRLGVPTVLVVPGSSLLPRLPAWAFLCKQTAFATARLPGPRSGVDGGRGLLLLTACCGCRGAARDDTPLAAVLGQASPKDSQDDLLRRALLDFAERSRCPASLSPRRAPGLESVVVNDLLSAAFWETEAAWRWRVGAHINVLETQAAVRAVRHVVSRGGDRKALLLLDSSVARGAIAKGRSSSRLLRPVLLRMCATLAGGGVYLGLAHAPTRLNVADDPTRSVPLRNSQDCARRSARAGRPLPEGRPVLQQTSKNRTALLVAFGEWLQAAGFGASSFEEWPAEEVSKALARFGRELFEAGFPYWHLAETINAVAAKRPEIRRQLQGAWDVAFAWMSLEPHTHHVAMPAVVLLAVLSVALLWGWRTEAGLFGLSWGALLRIGEAIGATRASLVLPRDVLGAQQFILLRIAEPKTRFRAARHQAAKLEAADLVTLVDMAFARLQPSSRLWPYSAQTLRRRLDSILESLLIPTARNEERPLDLGSFRPGGATYLLQATEDAELVRRRGRWVSHKVMEVYLQEIAASTFFPALAPAAKKRVMEAASCFPSLLMQARQWTQNGIPTGSWFLLWKHQSVARSTGD